MVKGEKVIEIEVKCRELFVRVECATQLNHMYGIFIREITYLFILEIQIIIII